MTTSTTPAQQPDASDVQQAAIDLYFHVARHVGSTHSEAASRLQAALLPFTVLNVGPSDGPRCGTISAAIVTLTTVPELVIPLADSLNVLGISDADLNALSVAADGVRKAAAAAKAASK